MKSAAQNRARTNLRVKVAHSSFECDGPEDVVAPQFDKWLDMVKFALSAERGDLPVKAAHDVVRATDKGTEIVDEVVERETRVYPVE